MCVLVETFVNPSDRLLVRHLAAHKRATTRLLHHLGSVVAGDFAKRFVTIDDRVVDNLSVSQEETAIRCLTITIIIAIINKN